MNKNGSIIIIEDDPDDKEILAGIFKKLDYRNEIIFSCSLIKHWTT